MRVLAAYVFVTLATIGSAFAGSAPDVIRFGYLAGIPYPTFIAAQERGYFAKRNLDVQRIVLSSVGAIGEALAAGNLDLGSSTPMHSILAISRGARIVNVAGFESTFTDKSGRAWEAAYVVVPKDSGIKSLPDLKGKKVAVNEVGSIYGYMLSAALKAQGLDPARDVTLVPIPFAQMAGAFVQHQVDAMIASADGYNQAEQRMPVAVIATHTSLEGSDIGLSSSIAVSRVYLKAKGDVVTRFLEALLEARLWLAEAVATNDPALPDLIVKSMRLTQERATFFLETRGGYYGKELDFVNLLDIPTRLIARDQDILRSIGLLKGDPIPSEDVVDTGPLRAAYATLHLSWESSKH